MNWLASDAGMVRKLVVKDWQVYQKQLAGYVAGMLLALGLIGMGRPWSFAAGALLLLVLLVVVGSYAIATSLMTERKEQTAPFIMSLPITPMDFYWGKLLGNLVIYLVPFLVVAGGMVALVLTTPLPDGMVVWSVLIAMFLLANFCISLCVAIAVESDGWNTFMMIAMMTLVGPYIYLVTRLGGITEHLGTEQIVWSAPALCLLAGNLAAIAVAIGVSSWFHARKTSFL